MHYKFSKEPLSWWENLPRPNLTYFIVLMMSIFVIAQGTYNRYKNKSARDSPEEKIEQYPIALFDSTAVTVSVVDVIDLNKGQDLDGAPIFFLSLQQTNGKFNGHVFIVEANPTDAYKLLGYRMRVRVSTPFNIDPRQYFKQSEWFVDSIYEPRSSLNE